MVTLGPELLANGNFEQSTGVGAASSIGPGWTTDYVPCGPNLFAAPCGGGRYAFFDTNGGQVTGNYPGSTNIPVIGSRSMAVNVSNVPNAAIVRWTNIPLVNGQTYRLRVSAAQFNNPFSVAVRINNGVDGVFAVTPPTALSQWQSTVTDFVYTGPTGNQTVSLNSNSTALGGNDHAFDNISLRTVSGDNVPCTCCPTGGRGVALTERLFQMPATLVANPAGMNVQPLDRWSDGDISGANYTGFTSAFGGQIPDADSPVIDLVFAAPADRIRGIRMWNQGGSDLNDSDGFGAWDLTFFAPGLAPIRTVTQTMGNGAAPFQYVFPGGAMVDNVERVRINRMKRLSLSTQVAPLLREVVALVGTLVFSCRMPDGTMRWYDESGIEFPASTVVPD